MFYQPFSESDLTSHILELGTLVQCYETIDLTKFCAHSCLYRTLLLRKKLIRSFYLLIFLQENLAKQHKQTIYQALSIHIMSKPRM